MTTAPRNEITPIPLFVAVPPLTPALRDIVEVMRERGLVYPDGRVRGTDFAAVWAELHPEALTR